MKKLFTLSALSLLSLIGCTEDINLTVLGGEQKIVIEGSIENGKPASVIVTRNSPLSQTVDFEKILVRDAQVYVSNGTITEALLLETDSAVSAFFVYKGAAVIGVTGQTYYLTVVADGKTFTATTTIPAPIPLDSVWWKPQPPEDSLGYAWAYLSDPPGTGNAYRWFAKRPTKDRRFIAPSGAIFDDKFIDGKGFEFSYNRGDDPAGDPKVLAKEPENEHNFFKKKDTIYIKFCTLDPKASQFYITYENALQSSGNPFASPVTIVSNIKGGGLGVWAGFGVTYDTIMPTK